MEITALRPSEGNIRCTTLFFQTAAQNMGSHCNFSPFKPFSNNTHNGIISYYWHVVFESVYSTSENNEVFSIMQASFQPIDKTCNHAVFISRPWSQSVSPPPMKSPKAPSCSQWLNVTHGREEKDFKHHEDRTPTEIKCMHRYALAFYIFAFVFILSLLPIVRAFL